MALEDLAHFAVGAVAVVGEHVDQDGHAAGTIAFVGDLFKRYAFGLAGAALDGPFDVVLGHADFAGLVNGIAKLEVGFRVAAAVPRGDDDRPAELAEELAALGVDGAFLVLDGCPVGMSRHGFSFGEVKLWVRRWSSQAPCRSRALCCSGRHVQGCPFSESNSCNLCFNSL